MDNKFKDMTSMRIGMLVIINRAPDKLIGIKKDKCVMWNCLCDCGKIKSISGTHLRSGITKSCGCLKKSLASERKRKRTGMKEYGIWRAMINRCDDENNDRYHRYGARGIKVCDRWMDYNNFIADMGVRPTSKHSIDRVDNDCGYNPNNCRWATMKEQANNKSNNSFIEFNGVKKTTQEWADLIGISRSSLITRIKTWGVEKALETNYPIRIWANKYRNVKNEYSSYREAQK